MLRPTPTLRGWVVGICGLGALFLACWFGRMDLLFVGLLLTLAPLAALIVIGLDRPWVTVTRSYLPDTVGVGESAQVRLELRNQSPRPAPALAWRDTLPAGFEAAPRRALPALEGHIPGRGDAVVLRYTTRARRRGAQLIGPLQLVRADPFGLAVTGYPVGEPKALVVTPRVVPLDRDGGQDARGEGVEQELVRRSIPSADEVIARDYRAGDPLRRVHWRATARQDRLMVRQDEQRSNPQAWLLLDTLKAPGASGSGERFEAAVELAASIAVHLLGLGYLVGMTETGAPQLSGGYELPGGDHRLLGRLASVRQLREGDDDRGARLAAALRRGGSAAPVFLVLADGGPETVAEYAPLRPLADPAVAFLLTPAAEEARPVLERAGWSCVAAADATDAGVIWARATAARPTAFEGAGGV